MKLYTSAGACSMADHIVLEWSGAPYEAQLVTREERGGEAFKRLNPAGAVPVLDVDGWVLTQNAAILNYLADAFPAARLGGDGSPKSRAEVNRWLAHLNADVHPAFHPLFGSTAYLQDPAAIAQTQQAARDKLRGHFERIDAWLATHDWLAGSRSIADPYLFVTTRWAKATGVDLGGLAHLERFFARMQADPAVRKVMRDEGLDVA